MKKAHSLSNGAGPAETHSELAGQLSPRNESPWEKTRDALAALLDLEPEERDAGLAQINRDDPLLAGELEALLLAVDIESEVFELPVGELLPGLTKESCEGSAAEQAAADPRVAGWKVGPSLGQGGMGAVYLAERLGDGFTQVGALKVTHARHADPLLRDRMKTEQRVLARLEHPAIARLIDAGLAADGRPFVVMERVQGTRIDHYCDERRLDVKARVALFRDICCAVEFAHRQLVIHCDLKPSNVLVDEEGRVKLLDFGIAKIVGDPDPPSEVSNLGPMTPRYASPEQLAGESASVASDVYSLGVLLWQLLVGTCPRTRVPALLAPSQVVKQMEEQTDLLACVDEGVKELARARGTRPGALVSMLRGDLDAILLRSVAQRKDERYQTAVAFAEDLERWLNLRPVRARPLPLLGRLKLFGRRNPVLTSSAVALATTVVVAALMLVSANRRIAAERQIAVDEAARSRGALVFLESALTPSTPALRQGADTTLAELLMDAEQRLKRELNGQPEVHKELLRFLSDHYLAVALYDRAVEVSRDAVGLMQEQKANLSPGVRDRQGDLDWVREMVQVLNRHGYCLNRAGRPQEASVVLGRSLALAQQHLASDSSYLLEALRYTSYLVGVRPPSQTQALRRRILKIERQRSLGEDSPSLAQALDDHGRSLHMSGELAEATRDLREAVAMRRAVEESDVEVANTMINLAAALSADGAHTESEVVAREALALVRSSPRPEPHATAKALVQLAIALSGQGQAAEASTTVGRAVDIYESMGVERQLAKAEALRVSGGVACLAEDFEVGLAHTEQALSILGTFYPVGSWRVARSEATLGLCELWSGTGEVTMATARLREALSSLESNLGSETPVARPVRQALSGFLAGADSLSWQSRRGIP